MISVKNLDEQNISVLMSCLKICSQILAFVVSQTEKTILAHA
jgi:hypothetical protein